MEEVFQQQSTEDTREQKIPEIKKRNSLSVCEASVCLMQQPASSGYSQNQYLLNGNLFKSS